MFYTNKTDGPKGVQSVSGLVLVEPGETSADLDVSESNAASAKATGWFDVKGKPTPPPKPEVKKQPDGKFSVMAGDQLLAKDLADEDAAKAWIEATKT